METTEQLARRIASQDYRMMDFGRGLLDDGLLAAFNRHIPSDFETFYAKQRDSYLEQAREIIAAEAQA